jgi:exopolysaccharide biosynthesis polyprenyl glycosylphosphotransferase
VDDRLLAALLFMTVSFSVDRSRKRPAVDSAVAGGPASVFGPTASPRERAARNVKDRVHRVTTLLCVVDWAIAASAVFVGIGLRVWQRGELDRYIEKLDTHSGPIAAWVLGGALLYSVLLAVAGTYDASNLYRMHFTVRNILQSAVLWPVLVLAFVGLVRLDDPAPRLGVLYCACTLPVALIGARIAMLGFMMHPRVRRATRARLLVVGWSEQAAHLREALASDLGQLREVVGCVPTPGGRFRHEPPADVPVLGAFQDLATVVGPNWIDGVVLADVNLPAPEIRRLIAFCQREYLDFHLVPEYFPVLGSKLEATSVSGVPLLGVSRLPLDSAFARMLKRGFDIAGALVGLVLSAPVIALFGLLVRAESPGPVIYRQRRVTRGGREFTIYKIRSMRLDAEEGSGAVWAQRDDPRRLRVGAFMRRTNIDELPQFWNVLKGDMSLVGPRPERPELIERFKHEIPNYNVRHSVRAGVTGWAAVHGLRGATDLRKRVEFDIYYLENWSLMLDVYCIAATLLKNKNAH